MKNESYYFEIFEKQLDYVERIYFGPKATGMELFRDFLTNKGLKICCEKVKESISVKDNRK